MRFRTPLLLTFCIVGCAVVAVSQQGDVRFQRLSIEQGLSQSSVFSITQDRKGFIWFATQDGLNKYDGYSFTHFEHEDNDTASLSDNYVNVLLEDHTGTLWAGTRGGGLDRFISPTGRFARYRSNPHDSHSLSNDEIRCLYEDRSGVLWIGTTGGLDCYDRELDGFVHYVHNPSDKNSIPAGLVQCIYEDHSGNFWVGMLGALVRLDRSTRKVSPVTLPVPGILCNWLTEDSEGNLWVAMQNSLYLYRNGKWTPASERIRLRPPVLARVILKTQDGSMWFGADNGLNRYDTRTGAVHTWVNNPTDLLSLNGNSVLSLFEDRQGILWVGTYDGVGKYAPSQFKFRHVQWGTGQTPDGGWNKIRSFTEDESGRIWVASQSGLMTYDRRTNELTRIPNDSWYTPSNNLRLLWSVLAEGSGPRKAVWVGTNGQGLIRLVPGQSGSSSYTKYLPKPGDTKSLSGPSPVALCETRDGTLWVGALWEGLNRFDKQKRTFTRFVHDPADPRSISGNEIWTLCEDRQGFLWIGTAGEGLDRLDVRQGLFTRFRHDPGNPHSLSDDKVTAVVEDEEGTLWIGTYTGLNRYDPHSETFEHFTTRDGLPNNVIYGIVNDLQGNLWLSTNNGLSRFSIKTRKFRTYDAGDGLQSNEFNHGAAYRCRDGEILFGGVNGFNIFSPGQLPEDTNKPTVVLTDFKVFNESLHPSPMERRLTTDISTADLIQLSHRDAVISFTFAALEFTNPEKNRYAYRMEGFDGNWVSAGPTREATYTNLDPGEYVFRVKAANSDGLWNETGSSVRIILSPPYWATLWFRALIVLAFLSIGPFIYYRRVSALKKKHSIHEEFSRRLIESQEAERKRVASELHDSIGQDLLVIKNKLLLGLQANPQSKDALKDFEDAVDHVSSSLKHVREISRNLRPVQLDQIGLTAALESAIETAAESAKLRATVHIDNVDNLLTKDEEINLFRIVQESLNNILKHSHATELTVTLSQSDRTLSLLIADDGRGLRESGDGHRGSGLGLRSMNERARILGGVLRIDSTDGRGTKVVFALPLEGRRRG